MVIKDYGKMLRSIIANVNNYIGSQVEKYGIKQGQYEYFLLIYSSPGINQLELARLKNVGKASVTKALKILEEDGFIKRITDENDRRNILCFITEKGEAIVEDLINVKRNAEEDLFRGFNKEDKDIFYEYLSLFYQNSVDLTSGITHKLEEE
ncbi:MAG: transcriptional regulator, TrmB [Clostridia bacterium]|jgi:DNA-binding MarR family transcriptional regulator|nr:transcriptional regulator, TrmB [Clostridia bacterium]